MREENERARLDKAKQDGKDENKINTILKLQNKGKSAQEISDLLDISIEEVVQILESHSNK
jgi:orotate phosphoribosyltransferase-like protein